MVKIAEAEAGLLLKHEITLLIPSQIFSSTVLSEADFRSGANQDSFAQNEIVSTSVKNLNLNLK